MKEIRKNISLTERIRRMDVGEMAKIPGRREVVKSILTRLKKEGKTYKSTSAGMLTGIIIERVR